MAGERPVLSKTDLRRVADEANKTGIVRNWDFSRYPGDLWADATEVGISGMGKRRTSADRQSLAQDGEGSK